jgi:hypothetical protein
MPHAGEARQEASDRRRPGGALDQAGGLREFEADDAGPRAGMRVRGGDARVGGVPVTVGEQAGPLANAEQLRNPDVLGGGQQHPIVRLHVPDDGKVAGSDEGERAVDDGEPAVAAQCFGQFTFGAAHPRLQFGERRIRVSRGDGAGLPRPAAADVRQDAVGAGSEDDVPGEACRPVHRWVAVLDQNGAARMSSGDAAGDFAGGVVDLVQGCLDASDAVDESQPRTSGEDTVAW